MHFHHLVPKDPEANVIWRADVLEQARVDPVFRLGLRELCRRDILFWINGFVWQVNPRDKKRGEVGPFITWDFQDRAILKVPGTPWNESDSRPKDAGILWGIENDEDILIEKSREMGASWLCLIVMLWLFLYRPWQAFLAISRSEEMVESPKPQSLFWKLDFILARLPGFLKGTVSRAKCYFGHQNQSTITGEASTSRAGVGGRFTAMFVDEFSQIKEAYEVLNRTSDSTGCRIFNGTHKGTGTAFHELSQRTDMKKLVMHWTDHPDKKPGLYYYDKPGGKIVVLDKQYAYAPDFEYQMVEQPLGGPHPGIRSPWYDKECPRKGSGRAVAEDLDIDPAGSAAQFFDPLKIRGLVNQFCLPPLWEGDISHDHAGKPAGLIPLKGGPVKLWIYPKADGTLPAGRYGMGGDISTGNGTTNSCLSAGDSRTGEKVLEYATPNLAPEKFALACCALGRLLKNEEGEPALFCWEHKGPGVILAKTVLECGYPNVYKREQATYAGAIFDRPGTTVKLGWDPSIGDNKRFLLESYRVALYGGQFINRSAEAMSTREILQYRYNPSGNVEHPHDAGGDDPTGARVNHGDRVIADALCYLVLTSLGKIKPEREDQPPPILSLAWRKALHDNASKEQEVWR